MEFWITVEPLYNANLDLVRKFFGPFNKKTFKIDLDTVRTSILCENFSVPSIALYRGSTVIKFFACVLFVL
jgi:hypothetical protein